MSVSTLWNHWDFSRPINPAFLVQTPSLPQKLQDVIKNLLPLLNAHTKSHSALSTVLLAAHAKDFLEESIDLFLHRKDWEELQPEMQKN